MKRRERDLRDTTRPIKRTATHWVVVLTAIGSLMAALDTLVVSTALSTIRLDLGASVEQLEWTVNAYNLSFAVLLITGAALGDRFGRRKLYAVGLGLFAVASAACALAPDVGWLIAARARPGRRRGADHAARPRAAERARSRPRSGARRSGSSARSPASRSRSGPLIGGAVVEGISWQWIFWINVPIGLVAIPFVLTQDATRATAPTRRSTSAAWRSSSGGALGIVWGLVRGNQAGWGSVEVVASLAAGVAAVRGVRRLGAARPRADAADALLPLPRVLGRQRGDLPHPRLAVRRGVLLRPAAPDRRSATARSAPACGCCPGRRPSSRSRRSPARWPTGSASGR